MHRKGTEFLGHSLVHLSHLAIFDNTHRLELSGKQQLYVSVSQIPTDTEIKAMKSLLPVVL